MACTHQRDRTGGRGKGAHNAEFEVVFASQACHISVYHKTASEGVRECFFTRKEGQREPKHLGPTLCTIFEEYWTKRGCYAMETLENATKRQSEA